MRRSPIFARFATFSMRAKARAVALEVECHGLCVPGGPGHKVHLSANLDERNVGGYSVAYRRDETHFPVYITAAPAPGVFTAGRIARPPYWLTCSLTAAAFPPSNN